MVTKRTTQRALTDELMDFNAELMRMQQRVAQLTGIAEVYESRIRGTGNLPPVTGTRGR